MRERFNEFYNLLRNDKVKNVNSAWSYVADEFNEFFNMGDNYFPIKRETWRNADKGFKVLKKIVKGKIEGNPSDAYRMFPEESTEHFFLKCVVKIVNDNNLSK